MCLFRRAYMRRRAANICTHVFFRTWQRKTQITDGKSNGKWQHHHHLIGEENEEPCIWLHMFFCCQWMSMFIWIYIALLCFLFSFCFVSKLCSGFIANAHIHWPLVRFNPLNFIPISSHLCFFLLYSIDSICSILLAPFFATHTLFQHNTKIGAASIVF